MTKNKKKSVARTIITPVWLRGVWTYTMPDKVKEGQHCFIKLPNGKMQKVIMPKKRTKNIMYVPWKDNFTLKESGFSKTNGELLDKADPSNSAY